MGMEVKSFFKYILDNFDMIYELFGLVIILLVSVHISNRIKRMTLVIVLLLLAELMAFNLEKWTQTFEHVSMLRPFLTACVYSMYPFILIGVMQLITPHAMSAKRMLLLMLPALISIPMYFTSQWTHLVCWFGKDNNYLGGPLSRWPYYVFAYYIVRFLVQNIIYFQKYSRIDRLIIAYIVFGAVAGVLYYIAVNNDRDYSAIFTSAILLYYIHIYIHMAKIDPLTKLLNRQSYYEDIRMNGRRITGVVSVDMNDLKYLNDHHGHEAGDRALEVVASTLKESAGSGSRVYRIGGDEFIVFFTNEDEFAMRETVKNMRHNMDETGNSCAFGYVTKRPGGDVNEAVNEADRLMYEDKAAIKKAGLANGEADHSR